MKKIGILGGTFDPPHLGHLMIANEVMREKQLDEVWFIPTNEPPHKASTTTSNVHRKEMLELAVQSNDRFRVNDIELQREGKSYTYDTMKQLQSVYKHQFYFIIGADMIEYLPKWYKIDALINMVTFIGVGRHSYQTDTNYPIRIASIPMVDISSTMIRERIRNDETVKYIIQEDVFAYIKEHRLYE